MDSSPSPSVANDAVSLVDLVRRAQEGSNEAAQLLFDRCRKPLLTVIRKVITRPIRRLYDSDDFLLSTFRQIFTRHFTDEVLASPAVLWPYLRRIAENQVKEAQRKYLRTVRHNITDDVRLEIEEAEQTLQSRELSPEDNLILKELVEDRLVDLMEQLPQMLRQIVELLLDGQKTEDIATRLNVEPKRVYRAIEWLEKQVMK